MRTDGYDGCLVSGIVWGRIEAGFTLLQRSFSGKTREADSVSDGLILAKSCPEEGVIVRAPKATLQDLIVRRMTSGTVADTSCREMPGMLVSPSAETSRLIKSDKKNMDLAIKEEILRQQKEDRDNILSVGAFMMSSETQAICVSNHLSYEAPELKKAVLEMPERSLVNQLRLYTKVRVVDKKHLKIKGREPSE